MPSTSAGLPRSSNLAAESSSKHSEKAKTAQGGTAPLQRPARVLAGQRGQLSCPSTRLSVMYHRHQKTPLSASARHVAGHFQAASFVTSPPMTPTIMTCASPDDFTLRPRFASVYHHSKARKTSNVTSWQVLFPLVVAA